MRGLALLLASAYPDRIAIARGKRGEFLMANGRAAALEAHDPLAGEACLAIGEVVGRAASARILLAAPLSLAEIEAAAGGRDRDGRRGRLRPRVRFAEGAPAPAARGADAGRADAGRSGGRARARRRSPAALLALGLGRLPWSRALTQWRDRVSFPPARRGRASGRTCRTGAWSRTRNGSRPSFSARRASTRSARTILPNALRALLPWELARRLDDEAPTHFDAPTGTAAAIDYEAEGGPSIALQGAGAVRPRRASRRWRAERSR